MNDIEFSDAINRLCLAIAREDKNECGAIEDAMKYDVSDQALLNGYRSIVATAVKCYDIVCCFSAFNIAFEAMKVLILRHNIEALIEITYFAKEVLFLLYLEDRKLYYMCADLIYTIINGGYPDLGKKGYVDIEKLLNGNDDGYMDIDYIYITYILAFELKLQMENKNEYDYNYKLACNLVDMYFEFTSFADLGYGFEAYNRNKANKLFKVAMKKPRGYSESASSQLLTCPTWTALAYATCEATGSYEGRKAVAKYVGCENCCPGPSSIEQTNMEEAKKARIRRIIVAFIILGILGGIGYLFRSNIPILFLIGAALMYGVAEYMTNGGKGSEIWYYGHHYIGPAYWINR